jgi:hypothetical protein
MTQHLIHFKNRLEEQIVFILLFVAVFISIGIFLPYTYYHYFDKTEYYKIFNPIKIEQKVYSPCAIEADKYVDAYLHRIALVPLQTTAIAELTLLRADGARDEVARFTKNLAADIGEQTIIIHLDLPCTVNNKKISSGKYIYQGTVSYIIRDILKVTQFMSEEFTVAN